MNKILWGSLICGVLILGITINIRDKPGQVKSPEKIETRIIYTEDAYSVMMGMLMSGKYQSVIGTNNDGKWTITAKLK